MSIAKQIYANENDDYVMPIMMGNWSNNDDWWMPRMVAGGYLLGASFRERDEDYADSVQRCPSRQDDASGKGTTYGMNYRVGMLPEPGSSGGSLERAHRFSSVALPSETVSIGDNNRDEEGNYDTHILRIASGTYTAIRNRPYHRHQEQANYTFFDGSGRSTDEFGDHVFEEGRAHLDEIRYRHWYLSRTGP